MLEWSQLRLGVAGWRMGVATLSSFFPTYDFNH
jgi:hypothetical protein